MEAKEWRYKIDCDFDYISLHDTEVLEVLREGATILVSVVEVRIGRYHPANTTGMDLFLAQCMLRFENVAREEFIISLDAPLDEPFTQQEPRAVEYAEMRYILDYTITAMPDGVNRYSFEGDGELTATNEFGDLEWRITAGSMTLYFNAFHDLKLIFKQG